MTAFCRLPYPAEISASAPVLRREVPASEAAPVRQIDMAFCRRLIQHMKDALDAEFMSTAIRFSGNLIRRPKSTPAISSPAILYGFL